MPSLPETEQHIAEVAARRDGNVKVYMDDAVGLVQTYLRVNGYFTVSEYPIVATDGQGRCRSATDIDILAFRLPGAGILLPTGTYGGGDGKEVFAPDQELECTPNHPEMLIGEVKEGKAELNAAAQDPEVLQAALLRFGCCDRSHVPEVVRQLLQRGQAITPCGHKVRLVAFGTVAPSIPRPKYVMSLGQVERFLRNYIQSHWDVLHHVQFKDPVFGFLVMLEKAERGKLPQIGSAK